MNNITSILMKNHLICKRSLNFFITAIYLFSSSAFPQETKINTQLASASSNDNTQISLNEPICMIYAASYKLTGIKIYLLRTRDNTECTPQNFLSITEIGIIQQLKTLHKIDIAQKMSVQHSAANMNFFNVDKKTPPIGGMNFFIHFLQCFGERIKMVFGKNGWKGFLQFGFRHVDYYPFNGIGLDALFFGTLQ